MSSRALIVSRYVGGTPRELARGLGCKIAIANAKKPKFSSLIINWGSTEAIRHKQSAKVLNPPNKVALSSDKLATFRELASGKVNTVDWTTEPEKARQWLDDGSSIVCRHLTRASAGEGIELVKWEDYKASGKKSVSIPQCPLYTRYFPKKQEVRVHVANNEVIHYAAKLRRRDGVDGPADPWIRTHERGWIFATQDIEENKDAKDLAVAALGRLGLHFGAVDIAIGKRGVACLEVNSAPGLEGVTIQKYIDYFKRELANAA